MNTLLDTWATTMWRACWQGGLVVLVVWAICRLLLSMPARFQCWLWRLAVLKFLVVLLVPWFFSVPLLPVPRVLESIAEITALLPAIAIHQEPLNNTSALSVPGPAPLRAPASTATSIPAPLSVLPAFLFFAWSIGVGWNLLRLLTARRDARRLLRNCHPIENTSLAEQLANQSQAFRIRRSPDLRAVSGLGSPMLVGILRPIILIPCETLGRLDRSERTMVLGHELAHVKRADLFWGLAAALVRAVFFFHPLVWLSERQLTVTQEIAADELAITRQRHNPAHYGTLLVSVVSKLGPARLLPRMSLGTAGPMESLKRRLIAMKLIGRVSRRVVVISTLLLAGVVLVGLVPWQLVAAEPKESEKVLPPPGEAGLTAEKATASVVAAQPDTLIVVEPTRGVQFFRPGDALTITQVKATSPDFKAGDKVIVKGHYTLSSRPKASLCLFVTATKGSGKGPIHPEQKLAVTKGEGDFELSETLEGDGYLHLTFYSVPQGRPFGGLYFGTAKQMTEIEHWNVKSWYTAK